MRRERAFDQGKEARINIENGREWRCPYGRFKTLDLYNAFMDGFNEMEKHFKKLKGEIPIHYHGTPRNL